MLFRVPRAWAGETCFIIAGGPSLQGFDASILKGRGRVIAINDSWRLAPWANVLYFCDASWWEDQIQRNYHAVDGSIFFHDLIYKGFWVSSSKFFFDHPQVRFIKRSGQLGLEQDPGAVRHGSNSGYQAINLAYHYGVRRIVLLGYDMHVTRTHTHWHNAERPDGFDKIIRDSMLPCFGHLVQPLQEAGVEVINATPGSALTLWPHMPLEQLLNGPLQARGAANPGATPTPGV